MSQRFIRSREPAPGGYWVDIEVTEAFTDGTSRIDRVFVTESELRGKSAAERRQAIYDALKAQDEVLSGVAGQVADEPAQTKAIYERRMEVLYADWQRWKATRLEAQARGLQAVIITALTAREDAAWTRYGQAILAWRTAPD